MSEATQEQEIRETAYALWEQAGSPEGQETEFWHKAKELVERRHEQSDEQADVDAASKESFPASDPVNRM